MAVKYLHDSLRLYITSEKFYLEPQDTTINEVLVIDRVTQELLLQKNYGQIPDTAVHHQIYGVVGVIRLTAGPYLIVISKKTKVGDIDGHAIWKVVDTELHSFQRTLFHLNEQQNTDNKTYLSMVDNVLKTDGLYFSTTFDLTHTMQRLLDTSPTFHSMPLHERADERFLWNGHVLREFSLQPDLYRYCLPVMQGYIGMRNCTINNHAFQYILISRRSVYQAGTRFYVRGLDGDGNVANYVETEQIVHYHGRMCSFVQTRGSIPLYWTQFPNLKYMPNPVINSVSSQLDGFQRHFANQVLLYGKQVIVNLINHKGRELVLERALSKIVTSAQNQSIKYESFDFHHECRKMQWHRLSLLVDRLQADIQMLGHLMLDKEGAVVNRQYGVFRSNCMDCLDRTNVVQGLIATEVLRDQLQRLGILLPGQKVIDQVLFQMTFRNLWADNADFLSKQYAGTGALKTDFTRTGKRTKVGLLMDGMNSFMRYFKNNFADGFRQDSLDLFLGNYVIEESEGGTKPSPLKLDRDWKFYALPVISLVAFFMCVISILIPDEHLSEQAMYILFWGGSCAITLFLMFIYGLEFVDRPRLTPGKYKMD